MYREYENVRIENAEMTGIAGAVNRIMEATKGINAVTESDNGAEFTTLELTRSVFMDDEMKKAATEALQTRLKTIFKKFGINKKKLVLAAGIGNRGMTADALGAKTLKHLEITEHYAREGAPLSGQGRLCAIEGGVSGITGIESFDIISAVCERVKPDLIIAIDTLAARAAARLTRVIEISDQGISPGSGVNNGKKKLNYENLGVHVIAIGVPLVIYARNIIKEYAKTEPPKYDESMANLVVTVKDIDATVEDFAKIIAAAINGAVHGNR